MVQYSKIIKARDEWKDKAKRRATEALNQRKTINRHLETIKNLKDTIKQLKTEAPTCHSKKQ
jgi:uncharacterized coiled-coil DUF342 family protein